MTPAPLSRVLDSPRADRPGPAGFGKVVSSIDVVDGVAQVPTGGRGDHDDMPPKAVVLRHASVAR